MEAVKEYQYLLRWRQHWNRPMTAATLKTLMRSAAIDAWVPGPPGSNQCTIIRSGPAIRVLNRWLKQTGDRYVLTVPQQLTIEDPATKVKFLATLPQPAQLSPEWFEMRGSALTASVIGAALGVSKYDKPIDVMLKKCGLGPPFKGNAATYHGQKYEDVAVQVYEYRTGSIVGEYGLLPHPILRFIAASPDGIVTGMKDRTKKDITGRMLEIKVPSSRKIRLADGSPYVTIWYHWQMLTQMEVACLDSCDHLQMTIAEYDGRDQYRDDQHPDKPGHTAAGLEKSCLLQWGDQTEGTAKFRYGPIGKDIRTLDRWLCDEMDRPPKGHEHNEPRTIWWYCTDYVCSLVERDSEAFNEELPKLGKLWDEIQQHRANACFELKRHVPVEPVRTVTTYKNRTICTMAPAKNTNNKKNKSRSRMVIDFDDE